MRYLYPCTPNSINPNNPYFTLLDLDPLWIAEVKKNGWRCLVEKDEGKLTLWTRHKTLMTQPVKEIREVLSGLPDGTQLDAELLNYKRGKNIADRLYLFDILILKGEPLYNYPFTRRRGLLEVIYKEYLAPDIELAEQFGQNKKELYYKSIQGEENEGIVLKHIESKYPISDRKCPSNPYWLKVKKIEDHIKTGERK